MVHYLITREVKTGYEDEFEKALRDFFSESVSDQNTFGAQLIRPFEGSSSRTYGILRSFPSESEREAFYDSKMFQEWTASVKEFVEGDPEIKELHGLEAFFQGDETGPATWKMALITWLGVNLVTTPFLMVLMPFLKQDLGLQFPWDNLTFNLFVVSALSWVVMPLLVKCFKAWLS